MKKAAGAEITMAETINEDKKLSKPHYRLISRERLLKETKLNIVARHSR